MEFELKIIFAKSSSIYYSDAIKKAKKFSRFSQIDENNSMNTILIDKEELFKKYHHIKELFSFIGNWKHSELYLNGRKISFWDTYSFTDIIKCQNGYDSSPDQEYYCINEYDKLGWGCKFLSNIRRQIPIDSYYYNRGEYWFNYGSFARENNWIINKDNLLSALNKEALQKKLDICKYFNIDELNEIVKSLPNNINLNESNDWEVIYEEIYDGITIEKRPVNIKPKSIKDSSRNGLGIRINLFGDENDNNKKNDNNKNRYIPNITFNDVGGIESIVTTIREVVELPMKNPKLFDYLGISPHKGILLHGPPRLW